jgi:hypothetical protein
MKISIKNGKKVNFADDNPEQILSGMEVAKRDVVSELQTTGIGDLL